MLRITRGDDVNIGITFTDVDLTGCTVFFTVKRGEDVNTVNATDSNAVLKAKTSSHADPLDGETVITLPAAETSLVEPGEYVYDIQLKDAAGKITTPGRGPSPCEVVADVGQRTT